MAQPPFEPSDYPDGEHQLHLAKTKAKKILDEYGTHQANHVTSQLEDLYESLSAAVDAGKKEQRLDSIETARERVDSLSADNAFNLTLTSIVERMIGNRLDKAEAEIEGGES